MNAQQNNAGSRQTIIVRLNLSAEKYKAYYQGQVQYVQTRSIDGRSVRFPASAIREFLTPDGVHGEFEIVIDSNNKLQGINRR